MIECDRFCYLQNQKTGCTFVEEFLTLHSKVPLHLHRKHSAPRAVVPGKFYFTNVREPAALYRSLFSYGLGGRGRLYQRLKRFGQSHLYEAGGARFPDWLRFVFDDRNATILEDAYTPHVAGISGFMTWRFLRLAAFGFQRAAPGFASRAELRAYVQQHFFMSAVLKQETLRSDLVKLATGPLADAFKDLPAAVAWVENAPKVNVSVAAPAAGALEFEGDLLEQLFEKERLLYRIYYPETPGFAQWRRSRQA